MNRRTSFVRVLLALCALAAAAPALAGDLTFAAGVNALYDDNVYGSSSHAVGDFSLQVVPRAHLVEQLGTLGVDASYQPTYEWFADESRLHGWDHSAGLGFDWKPSPTTTLRLRDDLARYRNARLLTASSENGTPIEAASHDPLVRNTTRLSGDHALSPTQSLSFSLDYGLWNFTQSRRSDQQSYGGSLQYLQLVSPGLHAGASVAITHAAFESDPTRAASDTTYYSLSAVLDWAATDRLVLSAAVGPAYVDGQRQRTQPPPGAILLAPIPQARAEQRVTAFASTMLTWKLERGGLSFGYERRDDFGSALGFSAVTDTVSARARYELIRNFIVDLGVLWEGRNGHVDFITYQTVIEPFVLPVRIRGDERLNSVSATLNATYRITEALSVSAWTAWRSQKDRSEVFSGFSDIERFQVFLGAAYEFDPIRW